MTESQPAKEVILARIRRGLGGAPAGTSVPSTYVERDDRDRTAILSEFVDRLRDYKAHVERVSLAGLPGAIKAACAHYVIVRLVVPADIPAEWLPSGLGLASDDPPLTQEQLYLSDGVVTGCVLAIAQTGTIVLDGGVYQGRRALSLVPDYHLCVVQAEQVVGMVPESLARLALASTRPMTFISGPSATSDIEFSRVEGVHGPRTLHVFLVGENPDVNPG